jgi:glycosyltransferase involved in cell wall biosynthesis
MCRIDGNFGGVEQHILTLASHYYANRYQPVIVPIANHGELEERAKTKGYECAFIPMPNRKSVFMAVNALAEIVKTKNIDLIHTFGIRSSSLAMILQKKMRIPWVITLPNINSTDYQHFIRAQVSLWWNNFLLRRADAVHVISPHLEQYVRSVLFPPQNIYTIINGVEIPNNIETLDRNWLKNHYQLPPDCRVIGTLGRLEEVKGFDILLHAFSKVMLQNQNVYVMIMGDGSQRERLKKLAVSLHIEKNVIFTGYTSETWQHVVGLDFYVCSSRSEGVPYSVLEAMACALPIISTQVGGIPGIINNQHDGVLVPPSDSNALASSVNQFLSNPKKAERLGQNAKDRVNREFTAVYMANQVQTMYDEMLRKCSI